MHGSYFEAGHQVENLLFKGFTITSIGGFIGLCLAVFAVTFFHEALRVVRQRVEHCRVLPVLAAGERCSAQSSPSHEGTPGCGNGDSPRSNERSFLVRMGSLSAGRLSRCISFSFLMETKLHILQSSLYVVQVLMAYIVMLIVMSYNIWLFLSVLVGAGLAHFMLGLSSFNANTLIAPPDSAHCDTGH